MLDVTALVQQMRDTLSEIHDTITSLDTKAHDEKLDALESQRDEVFHQLQNAFEKESAELSQHRQAERDQIAEKRRKEDEEIAARRRREDEEKATRDHDQDAEREQKLQSEKEGVEEETDVKMEHIEEEAKRMLDEGNNKLRDLEERRREINSMIDEQMKAPLPPPPTRRARRGTRVAQSGPPVHTEGLKTQESKMPPEAQSHGQAPEAETHGTRGIEPEEGRQEGNLQVESKQAEPQQEPKSTEQTFTAEEQSSRDQPQEQSAEPAGLHEGPRDTSAGHDDQSERQEAVSEAQPLSRADTSVAETAAQGHSPAGQEMTGEDQKILSKAAEQPAASSEKSEQLEEGKKDSAHDDLGDTSTEISAETEHVAQKPETEGREPDSGNTQEHSRGSEGDASVSIPSQSQNQALGAGDTGADDRQSNKSQAEVHNQEGPEVSKDSTAPEALTGNEVPPFDKSALESRSDQGQSQPAIDDPKTSEGSAEPEGPKSPKSEDMFLGVTKGGAAEEYVKMAEAEPDQKPQIGGDISPMPEQHSSSGSDHPREQPKDSGNDVEEAEPIHLGTSAIDQGSPGHTGQAHDGKEPSSSSGPADSNKHDARSAGEHEHENDQLQSRNIGDHGRDGEESRVTPTDVSHGEHSESPEHSREQKASDESQRPGSPPAGKSKHDEHSALFHDGPTSRSVESPNSEQEQGLGEHPQSQDIPKEPIHQQRDLELADSPGPELQKASVDELPIPGKDSADAQSAETQQDSHGNDQRDHPQETTHGEQERPDIDTAPEVEPSGDGHQDASVSEQVGSSPDTRLEREQGDNETNASFAGHESVVEGHDQPRNPIDQVKESSEGQGPQQGQEDPPNIAKPGAIDNLPHGSAHEQEAGDKRSDSGYETGMVSSRNLEDSTATLHEDQHEDQSVQNTEIPLGDAPSQSEQEKPREPRPEQILEGSGKDVSPPKLGGEQQGSGDHPVEETFNLSGNEPIPGTMTHGKDDTEDKEKELAGRDVSLPGVSHQQPVDDPVSGSVTSDQERHPDADETYEKQRMENSNAHGASQEADHDQTQTRSQPMTHEELDNVPVDSRSQGAEEKPQLEGSQAISQTTLSDVADTHNQDPSGKVEAGPEPFTRAKSEAQGSTANDGPIERPHLMDDLANTMDRRTIESQQDTFSVGDAAKIPDSQEHMPAESHVSQSPTTHDLGSDGFGSWSSRGLSGPADENEFSFKKRADSVQVGRSHMPADRELPFISTDGPHEDPDEGLFAVPPTPRHEVDQDKPSQVKSDNDSKPTSRASSRNGPPGADTLSPPAAEGPQGSNHEGHNREMPLEVSLNKEDTHHEAAPSPNDGHQGRPDNFGTSGSSEEKAVRSESHSGEPSNREEPDREQSEELLTTGTESMDHESSTGRNEEQQRQQHTFDSPPSPEENSTGSEGHLDESRQPETPSLEKHTSDVPTKANTNVEHDGEAQLESDGKSRDFSTEHNEESSSLQNEHDQGLDSRKPEGHTANIADDSSVREGAQENSNSHEMDRAQRLGQIEQEGDEGDKERLGEKGQTQHGGGQILGPRDVEDQTFRAVSPKDGEQGSRQDSDEQSSHRPQNGYDGAQPLESSHGPKADELDHDQTDVDHAADHQPSPYHSSQRLDAQHVNYDGEGYGVTPSTEYSNDPYADSAPRGKSDPHSADDTTNARQPVLHNYDLPDSAHSSQGDDLLDSDTETFETPLESAVFRKVHQDDRAVTPGHFTQALEHLPDESAHTVQGTDDLFDESSDDTEDHDDYGEAVVYQHPKEAADSSPGAEKTVYSTRGDENNTALGGHRSSLSLGSVGHRSQGSISSLRDVTPVRPTFGSYIGGPNIVRADWAAEHEDELRPPSVNPTPQLGPSTTHDTPEISPFALRNTPMPGSAGDPKGLSSSRWNPERPQTPTSATTHSNNPFATPQRQAGPEADLSLFVPRDVTHGRQDSIPASLHSQTTLDSSWSSPVHSSLPVDRHEPVIRDSWPAPAPGYQQYLSGWSSRPRGDTTSTAAEYDPFRPDNGGGSGGSHTAAKSSSSYNPFLQRGRAESSVSAAPSNPSVSSSPSRGSALFAKMRNIFENQSSNGGSDGPASPAKTRPVSGVFHPAVPAHGSSQENLAGQRGAERGGFLNEADHEIDERSAFLRSDGQPSGHKTADDVHSDRLVNVAEGRVNSAYTISPEVESDSDFRLAWLWVEGWRAQLRKGGDTVERSRWEWRVDDLLSKRRDNEARKKIPEIVARMPGVLRKTASSNKKRRHGTKKSVHWPDEDRGLLGIGERVS
ncbi:hypothetical protein diail_11880 [Diaporthe ilicicola]|nr:hypothetical protein diail_11880 [Diaporthe ilicicola]